MDVDTKDKQILQGLGVTALILFGSQAQGTAHEASDYDIFVIGPKNTMVYDAIYDIISGKMKKLTDIDIVFETSAPAELQNHVAKYGKILYEKDASVFADFRQKIMTDYADFAPHRAMYANATLARIAI